MATIDDVKKAYLGITRTELSTAQATVIAAQIDTNQTTLAQFISDTIATPSGKLTAAEVATYAVLTGNTPSSAQLDSLAKFAADQAASYAKNGYNAALAPFEALGAAITGDATTKAAFLAKYPNTLSNNDFIATLYLQATGGTQATFTGNPATGTGDHFLAQLAFYTNLYKAGGATDADAALKARGAIAGQIVALPFTDSTVAAKSSLDDATTSFLTKAAAGDATIYAAPLAAAPAVGQTFVLTNNIDAPGAVSPSINTTGTSGDDTYLGASNTFQTGDVLDGKAGNDTLKFTGTTGGTVIANLTSIETLSSTGVGGAVDISLLNASGYKLLESSAGSTAVQYSSVGTLTDARVANTTAGSSFTLAYAAAAVAGTADTQKFALDNAILDNGLTAQGIETFALTTTGKTTVTGVADTSLKTVTSAGAGALTMSGFTSTVLTSFDASTATGVQKIDFSTSASDVAVKGGTGNDVFTFGGTFSSKDTVDGGTGTDTVSLAGGDYRLAATDITKGLNALTSVEIVEFTGATAAQIDQATLTNAAVTKYVFQTTANVTDTVDNANGTTVFAFGASNNAAADATFALKGGNTILNLALEGKALTATQAFDNAQVDALNTGTALTVNLATSGASTVATDVNTVGQVTNTANATFVVTGDANTTFAGFSAAVNVNASAATGNLAIVGSGAADFITGGAGKDVITGGVGADTLTGGGGADTFVYTTLTDSLAAAPDKVTDFVAGTDKFDVTTLPVAITQGAAYTAAGTGALGTDIASALTNGGGVLQANNVAVVTITGTGAGTYLVINNGTAGYLAADDAVINITGLTGTLSVTDFV